MTARSDLSVDVAVSVNIIKVKRPLQLFPQRSPQQDRQSHHKILSVTEDNVHAKSPRGKEMGNDFKQFVIGHTLNLIDPLFVVSNALKR